MTKTLRDWFDAGAAQLRPSQPQEKPAKELDPPGVTVTAAMVRAADLAAWGAYVALVFFMWLKVLSVAQDQYETLDVSHVGPWENLGLLLHFPLILPYIIVVAIVPYVAKQVIPMMVSIRWRDNPWGKSLAVFIAVMVSFVLISGTATVGGHAVMEGERDAAVAVEQVQQSRAGLEASIVSAEAELKSMMENRNAYLAQAASVGEEQWVASYVAQARREKDARLPMIERATGAARAADAKRAEIKALRQELATAQGVASVASEVKTERLGALSTILGFLDTFWVLLLALVVDITCLFFPFLAHIMRTIRNRQLAAFRGEDFIARDGRPAWATEAQMIPDLREEAPVRSAPMAPAREEVYDAETGERLVKVKPREYYRRAGGKKKGEPVAVPSEPIVMPDDKGVVLESDSRAARSGVGEGDEQSAPEPTEIPARLSEGDAEGLGDNGVSGDQHVGDHAGGSSREDDAVGDRLGEENDSAGESADALYASLFNAPGPEQPGVEYPEPFGPPAPEKKLGAEGRDGVMIAAE